MAYGLYAPLNAAWLRERGVRTCSGRRRRRIWCCLGNAQLPKSQTPNAQNCAPPIHSFSRSIDVAAAAAVRRPADARRLPARGRRTDATRGCKHLCRPLPDRAGLSRRVPRRSGRRGARRRARAGRRRREHISFGDPDFFNGPTHARRIVERLAVEHPGLTYDVTIKIEHLLKHADMLPVLGETGCLFVTSAVESIDDEVLRRLRKGHTRADFVEAVALCRRAGVRCRRPSCRSRRGRRRGGTSSCSIVLAELDLVEDVAPIQLGIRLLVTAESALLELAEIREGVEPFDPASLTWPWRHREPRVDQLQAAVMRVVASMNGATRRAFRRNRCARSR